MQPVSKALVVLAIVITVAIVLFVIRGAGTSDVATRPTEDFKPKGKHHVD